MSVELAPLIVLAGASGSGKSTVARLLLAQHGLSPGPPVTTRARRREEREGVDYRFVDDDEFERLARGGHFAFSDDLFGHRYGLPREVLDRQDGARGRVTTVPAWRLADIAVVRPDALLVHLLSPGVDLTRERLTVRDHDAAELAPRLADGRRQDQVVVTSALTVPPGNDPSEAVAKIIARYDVDRSLQSGGRVTH